MMEVFDVDSFEDDGWQPALDLIAKLGKEEREAQARTENNKRFDEEVRRIKAQQQYVPNQEVQTAYARGMQNTVMDQEMKRQKAIQILELMNPRAKMELGFSHSIGTGPVPDRTPHG